MEGVVWRIGWASTPLDFIPREYCSWQSRFDDVQRSYRSLYVAREQVTCLREVLADLRPNTRTLADFHELFGGSPLLIAGEVSSEFREKRVLAPARIHILSGELVDVDDVPVRQRLEQRHARLSADDVRALARHLTRCKDCRLRATAYTEQGAAIHSMPRESPSPRVRQTILAAWHERDGSVSRPRRRLTVRIGLGSLVAAAVLGIASANTPIPGAIAGALGIGPSPTNTINGVQCNADGAALLRYATILKSPFDYNPGPHGVYNQATAQEMATRLLHPIWYVMSDNGGGISSAACKNVATEDTEVGFNPNTHTQLHVWGVLRNSSNP